MITELPRLLAALPAGTLPAGRLVTPEDGGPPPYWLSDDPAELTSWARLRARHHETGLWPLLLSGLSCQEDRPWIVGEVSPARMSSPDRYDAAELLAEGWAGGQPDEDDPEVQEITLPFGTRWPGLAAPGAPADPPDELADECAEFVADGRARLGLVPAARGADTLALTGWTGPMNITGDTGKIASVVRSWEERFGARVIGVGFDTLRLSVAAPPTTTEHALRVAAEHFAFCPDNIWQGSGTLAEYADEIIGANIWVFWWD
ncbi:DUF4253 domain-containing protein [Micromonospora sagamiensis]|uniref:Uncharacterized protein DUF4253 n=1 Tax=Micromonospora sagamiensis TaxID=47875 RepID=A0A562WAB8_9ACTN|nr:DUF4253 domain-containing protein [Micromonospora sagamiensis]TWJ27229.1 uncharacterized protein DUF4253 [Micromonospora sagamiensis]BCL13876.1 hypothetical protein GCM10017556_16150 [Micromonospora sagamiensis]